jgi:hypothetical protein
MWNTSSLLAAAAAAEALGVAAEALVVSYLGVHKSLQAQLLLPLAMAAQGVVRAPLQVMAAIVV